MNETSPNRPIRSFVRREGRITAAQQCALQRLWGRYGIDSDGGHKLTSESLFGNHRPLFLEIGFGNGEDLLHNAIRHPHRNYLGIEVHRPGVGHLLLGLERHGIDNVRVACADAVEILRQRIPDPGLDGVNLFFPDPWPKKKHHKRRIVQRPFVALLAKKLTAGAVLHIATDWEDYAGQILAVLQTSPEFENVAGMRGFPVNPPPRAHTRFEKRGRRLGHGVWELVFRRL
jgi:tRNA (guanine-N7-)-methyltransferase